MFEEIIHNITADEDTLIPFVIFTVGGLIAIVAIVFSTIKKTSVTKQREQTRRELAAYVAEGSMTPDDAERMLKAEPRNS
jgi:type II secretory pathway predicted ATPase ExeA